MDQPWLAIRDNVYIIAEVGEGKHARESLIPRAHLLKSRVGEWRADYSAVFFPVASVDPHAAARASRLGPLKEHKLLRVFHGQHS